MSVCIRIKDAVKKYGDNTIISGLSLNIKEGEFFTLLGGDFYFNDKRINDIDPAKRNIGMVFQNYAIFPHLSVRDNVAFGLKNRKESKETIRAETDKFMDLMHIKEYADRMPDRLSGGQQQRVALARALVIKPDVLLMDEPLSNLDAKLRVEMRTVIKEIQHTVGITNVYVTHDQEEAMAVSDRIAVMNQGVIQQVGTPKDIYQRPANMFVATFIGRSNTLSGKLKIVDGNPVVVFSEDFEVTMPNVLPAERREQDIQISVRPEEFVIQTDGDARGLEVVIDSSVFLGLNTHYFAHTPTGERIEVVQESQIDSIIPDGTVLRLGVKTEKINIFASDGSRNLLEGVRNDNEG